MPPPHETTPLLPPQHAPPPHRQLLSHLLRLLLLTTILGILLAALLHTHPPSQSDFSFHTLPASRTLQWTPCHDTLLCARLSLPLDYTDPTNPSTVGIAMVKIPALVNEDAPEYLGPVLLNPGGPGGSGVALALERGADLQKVVGGRHSIIGFDPRGVNNTTPATSCFPSRQERAAWHLRAAGRVVGYPSDPQALGVEFARSVSLGEACAGQGEFVGTPNVARDMVGIVDAYWAARGRGERRGLRYWGFSYGSVLGMTVASMFPDRVERVVVDGVVDPDDYYQSGWETNLQDAEKVLGLFYAGCVEAGRECEIWEKTPEEVKARIRRLMATLAEAPLPLTGGGKDWITDADVRTLLFWSLYEPLTSFPAAAAALAALERGDGERITQLIHPHLDVSPQCSEPWTPNTGVEADSAVVCQDGGGRNNTLPEFRSYVEGLKAQSETVAGNWARVQMACTGYRTEAKGLMPWREGRETGWRGKRWGGDTAVPLLFVSTRLDPVTPLGNAVKMARRFAGAGVVVVEGVGHCSVSAVSACRDGAVGRYFEEGVVEAWTECGVERVPWGAGAEEVGGRSWRVPVPAGLW